MNSRAAWQKAAVWSPAWLGESSHSWKLGKGTLKRFPRELPLCGGKRQTSGFTLRPCTKVRERASEYRYLRKQSKLWRGVSNASVLILNHPKRESALWSPVQIPSPPSVLCSLIFPEKGHSPTSQEASKSSISLIIRMTPVTCWLEPKCLRG